MQTTHDEGSEGTGTEGTGTAEGLDENPNGIELRGRVELRGGGWPGAIGYCRRVEDFEVSQFCNVAHNIEFLKFCIKELHLEHAAAVMVIEGMMLQELFPKDSFFAAPPLWGKAPLWSKPMGPFYFLRGELSPFWDPPLRLRDVVLAKVLDDVPRTKEQTLALLLRSI